MMGRQGQVACVALGVDERNGARKPLPPNPPRHQPVGE